MAVVYNTKIVAVVFASIFNFVISDGYSREIPAQPFDSGSSAEVPHDNHVPDSSGYGSTLSIDYRSRYHGPVAIPVVLHDGTLAETPSVAMARAAHLAALEKAKVLWADKTDHGSYGAPSAHPPANADTGSTSNQYLPPPSPAAGSPVGDKHYLPPKASSGTELNKPYHGPLAMPWVLPSGFLADTPSIAAARAAHLHALLKAQAEASKWTPKGWM